MTEIKLTEIKNGRRGRISWWRGGGGGLLIVYVLIVTDSSFNKFIPCYNLCYTKRITMVILKT
jgi:hypothetical protein